VADKIDPDTSWKTAFGRGLLILAHFYARDARSRLRTMGQRSPTFMSLLNRSANKYRFQKPDWTRSHDIAELGVIQNFPKLDVDKNGEVLSSTGAPTGVRAILFYEATNQGRFHPHPDLHAPAPGDGDTIRLDADLLFPGTEEQDETLSEQRRKTLADERLKKFISDAAHEMQHALNFFATWKSNKPAAPDFSVRVANFFKDEGAARNTDKLVLRDLGDPRGFRTLSNAHTVAEQIEAISEDPAPENIARSMPSGKYKKTYAELLVWSHTRNTLLENRKSDVRRLSYDDWREVWAEVDQLLDRPDGGVPPGNGTGPAAAMGTPVIERISDPLLPMKDYAEALALSPLRGPSRANSVYPDLMLFYLVERLIDHRWKKFLERYEGKPEYFIELERIAQENAAFLLESVEGLTFDVLYGKPGHAIKLEPK
jgi:hypothetical protein